MNEEIVVLFMKEYNRNTRTFKYVPVEARVGHIDYDTGIFTDQTGEKFYHITEEDEPDNINTVAFGYNFGMNAVETLLKTKEIDKIRKALLSIINEYIIKRRKESHTVLFKKQGEASFEQYNDSYTKILEYEDEEEYEELYDNKEEKVTIDPKVASISNISEELDIEKMYHNITENIIGQDEPIKKMLTAIYVSKTSDIRNNLLVIGKSGVGKTKTLELLSKEFNCDLSITDVSALTQSGYVGRSADNIFADLYEKCNGNIKKMENAIIALDEIDKKCTVQSNSETVASKGFTQELLGMLNGGSYTFEIKPNSFSSSTITVDTSKIIFIASGAFIGIDQKYEKRTGFGVENVETANYQHITNDMLIEYGMYPELLGRLPIKVPFNTLNESDYKKIILESKISPLKLESNWLKDKFNIELVADDAFVTEMAKIAAKTETGTRSLSNILGEALYNEIYYRIITSKTPYKKLTLKKEIINNPKGYVLE